MKIVVLRHGMPTPIKEGRIPASKLGAWINRYDASRLSELSVPDEHALFYVSTSGAIVSSTLQRSIDSANALGREKHFVSSRLFVEAGLPSANGTLLRLSPNTWSVVFRIMWLLGYSNNCESYKQAKQRAALAASSLVELAREHEQLLFVGHGIFNRLLVKELRRLGWSGPKKPGSRFWSIVVYEYLD